MSLCCKAIFEHKYFTFKCSVATWCFNRHLLLSLTVFFENRLVTPLHLLLSAGACSMEPAAIDRYLLPAGR